MSDPAAFASGWLSLREPHDNQARSGPVRDALLRWAGAQREVDSSDSSGTLRITELGAGTGSLLRDLGTGFERPLDWTLIDADRDLLALAQEQLIAWGEAGGGEVKQSKEQIRIHSDDVSIVAHFRTARLTPVDLSELTAGAQLILCSAFLDLAGESFVDALVDQVAARRKALYAGLTYDGRWRLSPSTPVDAATQEIFHRDMRRDKGLGGPALGPSAIDRLRAGLSEAGAEIITGSSDWQLDGASPLARTWISGVAAATACPAFANVQRESVSVGHTDAFAVPP